MKQRLTLLKLLLACMLLSGSSAHGQAQGTNSMGANVDTTAERVSWLSKLEQWEPKSSNFTAEPRGNYISTATLTVADPGSPTEGMTYSVLVRSGTSTIGGIPYSDALYPVVTRVYYSGAWTNRVDYYYVPSSVAITGGTVAGITDLAVADGGTGASDAATARTNLGLGSVENTALSTWAGSANLTTLGTIATGTWQGSTLGIGYGGTGATTAAGATAALNAFVGDSGSGGTKGLVPAPGIGDSTKYLKGDGTWAAVASGGGDLLAANNLSDLANAATARTNLGLGSVENTALSTWAGTTNITTLGTIATGTWQGAAIGDAYISSAATWNAKQSAITFGTGVQTALGVNIGAAGAPVLFNGALGTPSSGTLTNATGLPISTGVSGLGSGVATALAVAANGVGGFITDTGTVTLTNKTLTSPAINGGTISGITDLAVADGGTGASDAASARTNLGAVGLTGDETIAGSKSFTGQVHMRGNINTMGIDGNTAGFLRFYTTNLGGLTDLSSLATDVRSVTFPDSGGTIIIDSATQTLTNKTLTSPTISGGTISGITDLAVADGGTGASDAATARTNLGLGSIATQNAGTVAITGGTISGITDLAIADGGTGASDAATARTNLGLGSVENTALSTWAGTTNITTLGTIATGTWNGTTIAIANGGTGATTASGATAALNAFVGDAGSGGTKGMVPAPAAGDATKYLKGDGTWGAIAAGGDLLAANNLSDLANAATARTNLGLGSVENTALSTWAGTTNITTLGTIATGTWQGAAIGDAYISSAATWNAKQSAITFGTGVQTALGVNIGAAGAPVLFNGALGTPSSGTLTNATGLPISTGVSGLGTGIAAALAVNTGSAGAPVLFNGALGTPTSGTLTNATGLPISTGVSGLGTGVATALGVATNGAGGFVTDSGTVTLSNKTLTNPTVTNFTESVVAIGNTGTSQTIALTDGTVQTATLTGNCTFTMPTATAGKSFTLMLKTGAGSYTATFTSVKWSGGTAPTVTATASRMDIVSFISDGTNWYGSILQNFTP